MYPLEPEFNTWRNKPEIEFETKLLLDEVRAYLTTAPKAHVAEGGATESLSLFPEVPDLEIKTTNLGSITVATYNPDKDKTIVLLSTTVEVDDQLKVGLIMQVFQGAPFGHVFDYFDHFHYGRPLQEVQAVWNQSLQQYEDIDYGMQYERDHDECMDIAAITSMRLWLRKADVPLDILE